MIIKIKKPEELKEAAERLLKETEGRRIYALFGAMGAGKTTFVKAICEVLGSTDTVVSPTFTIVNEYTTKEKDPVYHFDFYRINKITEVYDIGIDEYFDSGNFCFMEWPELVEEILPPETVRVNINIMPDDSREITFET
ncbi:MAG TPA: tRNA (adenosine(37)-N6)-threonylcarbamoyltransferase complex ATPase subunit type 1 TsaE [Bacteroidetes bacterium]|nr:tRNA (adenosine(37)-N6)-threonylcarbamoyltransferase complex ATPase subunit type 1 TsaE [Bacteroidota bacterium]